MKTYVFRTPNAERSCAIGLPSTTTVKAPSELQARHLAMLERWGKPHGSHFPFSSEPSRFAGIGLILETVDGAPTEV